MNNRTSGTMIDFGKPREDPTTSNVFLIDMWILRKTLDIQRGALILL